MSTIATPADEAPLWAAVKKHEDLKAMVRELGAQKLAVQNQLARIPRGADVPQRKKLINEARQVEATLLDLRQQCSAAGIERNKADQALHRLRAASAGVHLSPVPMPAPRPALPLNTAQLKHLRLLAVRIRSDELKLSARIASAEDFVAIVLPLLKDDSEGGVR